MDNETAALTLETSEQFLVQVGDGVAEAINIKDFSVRLAPRPFRFRPGQTDERFLLRAEPIQCNRAFA